MSRLATLFLTGDPGPQQESHTRQLESLGYTVVPVTSAEHLIIEAGHHRPDVILLDGQSENFSVTDQLAALKTNATLETTPVVWLAVAPDEALFETVAAAKVSDVIIDTGTPALIDLKLAPLVRLSTMFAELDRRVGLARESGVEGASSALADKALSPEILFVQPDIADITPLEAHYPDGIEILSCETLFQAEDLLYDRNFDAVVVNTNQFESETVESFCSHVRNNTRLFNMPVILLGKSVTTDEMTTAIQRGASDMIERPGSDAEYVFRLSAMVKRQQTRWQIREAMDTAKDDRVMEPLAGTWSPDFMKAHLEHLIDVSHRRDKHLTLVQFNIGNVKGVRENFGDGAAEHLINQIGQWLHGLTRVEDLVCHAGENRFYITLADTPLEEARFVMQRIAGVLSYTDFALYEVYQPVSVWVEVGLAALDGPETVDGFMERVGRDVR